MIRFFEPAHWLSVAGAETFKAANRCLFDRVTVGRCCVETCQGEEIEGLLVKTERRIRCMGSGVDRCKEQSVAPMQSGKQKLAAMIHRTGRCRAPTQFLSNVKYVNLSGDHATSPHAPGRIEEPLRTDHRNIFEVAA